MDRIANFLFPPFDRIGILYFTYLTYYSDLLPDKVCHSLAPLNRLITRQQGK